MKITIYQVNPDRDTNHIAFMRYENLPEFQGSEKIDSTVYDKVYKGEVDCKSLEDVYMMFNLNHPYGYKARSLSVSDVVEVSQPGGEKPSFYFCDSFGFREIEFEPEQTMQGEFFYEKGVSVMDVDEIREQYPVGTVIELHEMKSENRMPAGLKGRVKLVDDMGQIHMRWENGSALALNIEEDTFRKIPTPEKISVLLVEPNKYPKMIEIEDTLEAMQSIVGGDIEEYMPFDDEVAIICNEEGKYNGMRPNRAVYTDDKEMTDIIFGQFFICYAPIESEKFQSLSPELAKKYEKKFKNPERFRKDLNGKIVAEPFKPKSKDYER